MGIRTTAGEDVVALFDSVTGWAFGPVFDTEEDAAQFLEDTADLDDLRSMTTEQLEEIYSNWCAQRVALNRMRGIIP